MPHILKIFKIYCFLFTFFIAINTPVYAIYEEHLAILNSNKSVLTIFLVYPDKKVKSYFYRTSWWTRLYLKKKTNVKGHIKTYAKFSRLDVLVCNFTTSEVIIEELSEKDNPCEKMIITFTDDNNKKLSLKFNTENVIPNHIFHLCRTMVRVMAKEVKIHVQKAAYFLLFSGTMKDKNFISTFYLSYFNRNIIKTIFSIPSMEKRSEPIFTFIWYDKNFAFKKLTFCKEVLFQLEDNKRDFDLYLEGIHNKIYSDSNKEDFQKKLALKNSINEEKKLQKNVEDQKNELTKEIKNCNDKKNKYKELIEKYGKNESNWDNIERKLDEDFKKQKSDIENKNNECELLKEESCVLIAKLKIFEDFDIKKKLARTELINLNEERERLSKNIGCKKRNRIIISLFFSQISIILLILIVFFSKLFFKKMFN